MQNQRIHRTGFLSVLALTACASSSVFAADYAWNAGGTANWTTGASWSPVAPAGGPTSSDNVLTPIQHGVIAVDTAAASVNNWTFNSSTAQLVIGANGLAGATLTINGTMTKSGSAGLTFRGDGGATKPLNMSVNALSVSTGDINFGVRADQGNYIGALTFGSMSLTGGRVLLNGADNAIVQVTGALTMSGSSTVLAKTGTGTNDDSTLRVGSLSSASSTATVAVNDYSSTNTRAVLDLRTSGTATFAGALKNTTASVTTGGLSVQMNGTGTQILTGTANTYTLGTTINSGTLRVNNASNSGTGVGAVTVNNTGTLGGTGIIAPTGSNGITVANGGTLAPGESIGTFTFNSLNTTGKLVFQTGAGMDAELGTPGLTIASPGASDLLRITSAAAGDVAFNNTVIDALGTGAVGVGNVGWYKLFDTTLATGTTWTGLTLSGQQITSGLSIINLPSGLTGTFILGDGTTGDRDDIYLQVVPEPATLSLLALAGLGLLRCRR